MPELILSQGGWRATVRPDLGGILTSLSFRQIDILRRSHADVTDPLKSACFPMVPYCNRIANGRFEFDGVSVCLGLNFPPEPHSIHGLGWQREWSVIEYAVSECRLSQRHDGLPRDEWGNTARSWPWAYSAEQRIELSTSGCTISLTLTNASDWPMPAGLGLHPYFRRRQETRLRFGASHIHVVGADMIPTGETEPADHFADFTAGTYLPAMTIDHCYADWDGAATISDDLGNITAAATGARYLHLYSPHGGDTLCLEPTSHPPDALNQAQAAITVLAPGESMSLQLRIAATPALLA